MRLFVVILALRLLSSPVISDDIQKSVSTSIPGMEELLETERQLLLSLENYAKALEAKLTLIRSAIAAIHAENLKSVQNAEEYLSNPLNSYALIRRMHTDWIHWELFMQRPVGEVEIAMIQKLRINLTTSVDMDEATRSMLRLQTTYDLKAEEMAAGLLNGKQYNTSLSSHDCLEIGQRLIGHEKLLQASNWLNTSLQRYQENEINAILGFDQFKIIDLYAVTCLKQNKYSEALAAINTALQLSPNNAKYLQEKSKIEHEIIINKEIPKVLPINAPDLDDLCCRGVFDNRLSRLHCRYNTTTHPFLQLAPLKMEELQTEPYMVQYHDVISDAEIAEIKKLALPKLERSTIFNAETNRNEPIRGRTSKASTFDDYTNNATKRIVQRIADMSGFDMKCSEALQVINYGIGGYYGSHFDALDLSQDSDVLRDIGDRISTVMFYGSALLWYNLNSHGKKEPDSLHAACPVIVGSKWVMTKWIHERCQMFRRPCH